MSIYFIACGGFIKIGFSERPERRVSQLFSSASAYSAPRAAYEARGTQTLLGYIEGNKSDERRLHLALDDYAAGCEWFVDEPPLRDHIVALLDEHPDYFASLTREGGPAWDALPPEERGGGNTALILRSLASTG